MPEKRKGFKHNIQSHAKDTKNKEHVETELQVNLMFMGPCIVLIVE